MVGQLGPLTESEDWGASPVDRGWLDQFFRTGLLDQAYRGLPLTFSLQYLSTHLRILRHLFKTPGGDYQR